MLLKQKDSRDTDINELNRLLGLNLTAKQRFFVERELKCLQSGERNEQNSAYYLDFRFKNSQNWALLHDLRIEHRGRVAQIDHLLINRFLDIYSLPPEGVTRRWRPPPSDNLYSESAGFAFCT